MIYILFIIVFLMFTAYFVYSYNKLSSSKQSVNEAWSGIEVQLERRENLIPNLVSIVKAYAAHEKEIFEKITELRTKALNFNPKDIAGKATIEKEIEKNLKTLLVIAESYPQLKADSQFLKLQKELVETEDQIASARRIYNGNVANYNELIYIFPENIVAFITGFKESKFFQKD